jgi:hypothetical protein
MSKTQKRWHDLAVTVSIFLVAILCLVALLPGGVKALQGTTLYGGSDNPAFCVDPTNYNEVASTIGTTETAIGSGCLIPSGTLFTGRVIRVTIATTLSSTSGPTFTFRLRWGGLSGSQIWSSAAVTPSSGSFDSSGIWMISGTAAAGSSVPINIEEVSSSDYQLGIPGQSNMLGGQAASTGVTPSVATNAAEVLIPTIQFSASTAGNNVNVRQFVVEVINY